MSYTGLVERLLLDIREDCLSETRQGLLRKVDAAIEALTRPVDGWQPIETAPRDGSDILLGWWQAGSEPPVFHQTVGCWEAKFEAGPYNEETQDADWRAAWTDYTVADWRYEEHAELHPTHWQKLPSFPALAAMETPHADG